MSDPAGLHWTVHLARRYPARTAFAVAIVLAGAAIAGIGFASLFLGALAAVLLFASIADYLLPVRYALGAEGASARGLWHRRHLAWSQVRRVIRDELGVKLSPLPRPSRLEAYRGIYLWFAGNEAEVMATIARHTTAEAAGGDDRPPG